MLAMLRDLGLRTASSDAVAREVFLETAVQEALERRLGVTGPVAPVALREAILRDSGLRRWTNRLMHPLVGERMRAIEADVIEVPLLFEACLQGRYREVWCVTCGPEERSRRLKARYGPDADPAAYGRWQLDERVKAALADVEIRTNVSKEAVFSAVRAEAARCFPTRVAQPE